MSDIPQELRDQFYSGQRNEILKFCVNDAVQVAEGPNAGSHGAVISIETVAPEVTLLVELETGADFVVPQRILRHRVTLASTAA